MISLCGQERFQVDNAQLLFVTQIITTSSYKSALGSSHMRDLGRLSISLGGVPINIGNAVDVNSIELNERYEDEYAVTKEPPIKKRKLISDEEERHPIRVICSAQFLSHVSIYLLLEGMNNPLFVSGVLIFFDEM